MVGGDINSASRMPITASSSYEMDRAWISHGKHERGPRENVMQASRSPQPKPYAVEAMALGDRILKDVSHRKSLLAHSVQFSLGIFLMLSHHPSAPCDSEKPLIYGVHEGPKGSTQSCAHACHPPRKVPLELEYGPYGPRYGRFLVSGIMACERGPE